MELDYVEFIAPVTVKTPGVGQYKSMQVAQMAAAFFNQLLDRHKAEAVSAGTEPGLRVHPEVLAVMQEMASI